jgi:histidinol phosphatase-like enzyme (inositol monophosphatase family)
VAELVIEPGFLRAIAAAAGAETLARFRKPNDVSNKKEIGFDPVTEADRAAELAIRALIRERFPGHGILGEEFGGENLDSRHVWVIDPIDGTRAFITGLPVWGTLVGLLEDGDAIAGMMAQPYIGELFLATAETAFWEGPHGVQPLRTRAASRLPDASLFTTSPHLFSGGERVTLDRLEGAVRLTRYGCDCYAFAMLAAGHVDLVVEADLKPYDIVALIPLIERAGGIVTRWDGAPAEQGGTIIAAANETLWRQAIGVIENG